MTQSIKIKYLLIVTVLILFHSTSYAQVADSISVDSISFQSLIDTTKKDASNNEDITPPGIKLSKDAIEDPIKYKARDSMRFNVEERKLYLYGDASITYEDSELSAPLITLDSKTNIAQADSERDSTGRIIKNPKYQDKDGVYEAAKFVINTETKKGIVDQLLTTQDDLYIYGDKAKIISEEDSITGKKKNIFYSKNTLITTCKCEIGETPDYGIRSTKQKFYPDKRLAVIGPSYLEIKGIPTPLVLPFGFFPMGATKKSGLLMPNEYGFVEGFGYGLGGIGYYWAVNDYLSSETRFDIYTRGRWGIQERLNYKKRYKYSGDLNIEYSNLPSGNRSDIDFSTSKSTIIQWRHTQDRKAHPYQTLSANVNISSSKDFFRENYTDARSQQRQNLTSNARYSYDFPNSGIRLNTSMSHQQNLETGSINFTLPTINLNTQGFYPFRSKSKSSVDYKWYDKINITYNSSFNNRIQSSDSTLFSEPILDQARFGMTHSLGTSLDLKLFKYFNLRPSIRYNENWFFREQNQNFLVTDVMDSVSSDTTITTINGEVVSDFDWKFNRIPTTSFNASLQTKLFGMLRFKNAFIKGIRHEMTPSATYSFTPELSFVKDIINKEYFNPSTNQSTTYNPLSGGVYGASAQTRSQRLSFNLNNRFEAKFRSRDTLKDDFKIRLLERLNFSGSYNLEADSLQLSTISATAGNSFFFNILNVNANMRLNPYFTNENGSQRYRYKNNKPWLKAESADLTLSSNFSWSKLKEVHGVLFGGKERDIDDNSVEFESYQQELDDFAEGKIDRPDELAPPSDRVISTSSYIDDIVRSLSIRHNYRLSRTNNDTQDTTIVTAHSLSISSSFNLTKNWSVSLSAINYDFLHKEFREPDFRFSRDLNCWRMDLSWQPRFNSFTFFIGVKPSTLDFIKREERKYERQNEIIF